MDCSTSIIPHMVVSPPSSYLLHRILHFLPKHRTDYHLNVLDERIMTVIIAVLSHLIKIDNRVVYSTAIFYIGHVSSAACC